MKHHIQNMESYKKSNKLFNLHLKISEEINNKFKSNNLNNVIEMEKKFYLELTQMLIPLSLKIYLRILEN